jgi:Tol biopolymer transport system component
VVNRTKGVDITPRNYFRAPLLGWVTCEEYKSQEEIVEEKTYKTITKCKIAFRAWRGANQEIYIMNTDGSGQTNLTNHLADDYDPCFSPDGSKIAFASLRDENYEIYIMNVDGSGQTNLTNHPAIDCQPCFPH